MLSLMPIKNLVHSPRIYNKSMRYIFIDVCKILRLTQSKGTRSLTILSTICLPPFFILININFRISFLLDFLLVSSSCLCSRSAGYRATGDWRWTKAALYQHFLPVSRTLARISPSLASESPSVTFLRPRSLLERQNIIQTWM